MATTSTVAPDALLMSYLNRVSAAMITEFGTAQRTDTDPERTGHKYGMRISIRNSAEPPLLMDVVNARLTRIGTDYPAVQIEPQVDNNWIAITAFFTPSAFTALVVASQLSTKGAPFTAEESAHLAALSSTVAESFFDADPSWADVATAIASKCAAFAALLVPPVPVPTGWIERIRKLIAGIRPK